MRGWTTSNGGVTWHPVWSVTPVGIVGPETINVTISNSDVGSATFSLLSLSMGLLDSPAIYDDIMENLRVRYVISYVSSNPPVPGLPRKIRVELIDSKTAKPLTVLDSNGKSIPARVFFQESYSPAPATGG